MGSLYPICHLDSIPPVCPLPQITAPLLFPQLGFNVSPTTAALLFPGGSRGSCKSLVLKDHFFPLPPALPVGTRHPRAMRTGLNIPSAEKGALRLCPP